jgi:hypothetical protein
MEEHHLNNEGLDAIGFDVRAYTGGTLEWIGSVDSGIDGSCSVASWDCGPVPSRGALFLVVRMGS